MEYSSKDDVSAPTLEKTGDGDVDRALGHLSELNETPLQEHVRIFELVHHELQDHLSKAED